MKILSHRSARAVVIALVLFIGVWGAALAHPLGNFTINHYARLEVAADALRVRYVLDLAEIPTFQEKQLMDADRDGSVSDAEQSAYLATLLPRLQSNLHLAVNGTETPLTSDPQSVTLELLPGQGGLQVMRVAMWLDAEFALNSTGDSIEFRDDNYKERLGWREIVVRALEGASIDPASVPTREISSELTAYPEDLLANPPALSSVNFTVQPGTGVPVPPPSAPVVAVGPIGALDRTREAFGNLLTTNQELTPAVLFVSLLAAMALGALHAFSPGHGKAVVGAYLVGSRGNWQHAVFLGLIVTATHTAGVYALGFVTLFLSAYVLPEQLFPWLGFISGLLVAIIGIQLLSQRWRAARMKTTSFDRAVNSMRGQSSLELAHAYAAPHAHAAAQTHSHVFATPEEEAAHAREHLDEIKTLEKPSWKNLVSLGISGGLLPCPSALVVMLSAIALGRVLYGLYLIVGFSLGLASVLVITGLLLLYAGKFAGKHLQGERVGPVMRFLPIVGALVVSFLGVAIALESFLQTGLVP